MEFRIIATIGPLSGAFVRVTSLDTATTWNIAVTFLTAHRALGACLTVLWHDSIALLNGVSYHDVDVTLYGNLNEIVMVGTSA